MTRFLIGRAVRNAASLVLFLAAAGVFQTSPVSAQSFCGPLTLVNFNGINGQYPVSGVTFDTQGNMYGTTAQGGPSFNPIGNNSLNYGLGTIWKYSTGGGLVSLFSFSGNTTPSNNGYRPLTPLVIDGQGNLYGTTYYGGNEFFPDNNHFGWGTIFQYSAAGQFSVLHEFSGPDGANPVGMLLDSKGNLWGTTWQGGLNWNPTLGNFGLGTIFESSGGTVTNPVLFSSTNGGGNIAAGLTSDGQGNYYGTTYEGGTNGFGTLFKYASATGQLTALVNFNRTDGSLPAATVTLDGQGNVYGTTYQGGAHSSASNFCCGNVWKYSLRTGVLTTMVSFDGDSVPADGMFPMGGVIYESSAAGVLSALVTFSGPNGWNPEGNLVFDSTGNLYGITNQGGTSGYGTVFKLTPNTSGGTCGGITPSSLTLNPTTVSDGQPSTGTVTLSAAAPSGGSTAGLSSNSTFAIVPSSVTVPAGAPSATFTVNTNNGFVLSNTAVTITATLGNSTVQANMTITPGSTVTVSSLTLNPTSVQGGSSSQGTVTLSAAAPSGGTVVSLSSQSSAASVPGSVTVAAGATSARFTVSTQTVTTTTTAVITATLGSSSAQASLTITSASTVSLSSLTLNPTSVSGGSSSTGTVTLSSSAPSGGAVVTLSSSNTSVATVPSSVTVSAGKTSATFSVSTKTVSSNTSVAISGTYGGATKSATLTVTSGRHH